MYTAEMCVEGITEGIGCCYKLASFLSWIHICSYTVCTHWPLAAEQLTDVERVGRLAKAYLSSPSKSCRLAGSQWKINFHPLTSNAETCAFLPAMEIAAAAAGRRRQRGTPREGSIAWSWDVVSLPQAIGPWRTAIHRYLSSLFLNHFSFIRHFEVVSDGTERRSVADIHKGHKTIQTLGAVSPRWLISTEHLLLFALIHAPCINGHINIRIHVLRVSCNPFKDMRRWRAGALNPYNETSWYNLFNSVFHHKFMSQASLRARLFNRTSDYNL